MFISFGLLQTIILDVEKSDIGISSSKFSRILLLSKEIFSLKLNLFNISIRLDSIFFISVSSFPEIKNIFFLYFISFGLRSASLKLIFILTV